MIKYVNVTSHHENGNLKKALKQNKKEEIWTLPVLYLYASILINQMLVFDYFKKCLEQVSWFIFWHLDDKWYVTLGKNIK